jgi:small subunit ribosomal protein S1
VLELLNLPESLMAARPTMAELTRVQAERGDFGEGYSLVDRRGHEYVARGAVAPAPELSWRSFEDPADVVSIGRRVTCEVLEFDTHQGEARLSLRATQTDPFLDFARTFQVGQILHGPVTKLVPFGAFVRVADGIEGLIHLSELSTTPIETPDQAVQIGEEVIVTITDIDTYRRRLALSRRH